MGTLRESVDPNVPLPGSKFFGSDLPIGSDILLDDIYETVIVKNTNGTISYFKYDEWNNLRKHMVIVHKYHT